MKFGIITHYDVHNHGAILQLYALIQVLKSFNVEAKALRYDKNYDFLDPDIKAKYDISLKSLGIYSRYLLREGYWKTKFNYEKRKALNNFKYENGIIGNYYSQCEPLDGVIVGSDEVFALHTGPTPALFGYCLPSANIFAYAASFGPTTITDICNLNATSFVRGGLSRMDLITVRDANSASIVKNLCDVTPQIVVDPVLLYGYENEVRQANKTMEDYMVVYAYDARMNDKEEIDVIRTFAKKNGLKIVSPGFYHSWCDLCVPCDPLELLGWFKHAKFVLTDTFHGAVLSIITESNMAVITREANHLKLSNLLTEYALQDHICQSIFDFPQIIEGDINYEGVNAEIRRRRFASLIELKKMVEKSALYD